MRYLGERRLTDDSSQSADDDGRTVYLMKEALGMTDDRPIMLTYAFPFYKRTVQYLLWVHPIST